MNFPLNTEKTSVVAPPISTPRTLISSLADIFLIISPRVHPHIADRSDLGRRMEGYIVANDYDKEICVWHEKELCEALLTQEILEELPF